MKKSRKNTLPQSRKILISMLAMLLTLGAWAQKIQVTGVVVDAMGEAVIGAGVVETGTTNGAVTNLDGQFKLEAPTGAMLTISYIGYKTQQVKAAPSMNITLEEDVEMLDEVVVIGYGSVKRKDVTTAISVVSTKDMELRPLVSAAQAIQGKAAGVSVIQPNGTPGGEMAIRVRGTTSFNGSNDPLYVVDGVPVDNIRFLSPNDIESLQILKDASSAAIYGSRAANGVIIIGTKNGAKGQAKVSFNAQLSLSKVSNTIKPLNTAQYYELQKEIGMISLPEGLTDVTDWTDEAYSTGVLQSYQASVSNGNDKTQYFISGGYLDEKGILNTALYKRYNFRANIDSEVRSWLRINANISYSDYTSNGVQTGLGANRGGVVLSVVNTPSYAPIWNQDPAKKGWYFNEFHGIGNITNPLENMERGKYGRNKENRLLASGSALITFMPRLTLKSTFTLDRRNALNTSFLDPTTTAWGRENFGTASDGRNMNTVLVFDNVLTYNKTIGKHGLEFMAGSSWTDSDYSNSWINGSHYRDSIIQTLNAANKISWNNTGSGLSQWGIMSYFGRLAYNFDSKYLLTANVRTDGSSKLHPDHRWATFPSFSAAWRISSEAFMEDAHWLDDLKIRGGWGKTGNQSGVGDYSYLQLYNISRVQWWEEGKTNALPGVTQANLRTKDLRWETTAQTNIGVDFAAFGSRLIITADYYYKHTTDMLMHAAVPGGQGATSIMRNEGAMTNRGFELTVSSKNLQGVVDWSTDFNISFNRNKLTKLELQKIYTDGRTSDFINENVVRNEVGRPLGGFYGYISDGVNPETGELMYRDLNEDGRISVSDRTYIGDPNPDFIYGLTNTLSWKGLSLTVFIQGSYGNDIFNASRIETEGMYDGKNQSTRTLNRWRIPGQITNVPKANFDLKNSTYFVEDGSYLRVKDITLSYNVKAPFLKKAGISKLQPYFTATNLLTWTNYSGMDPEVNQWGNSGSVQGIDWGTYPHSKSFVFGVNVEF